MHPFALVPQATPAPLAMRLAVVVDVASTKTQTHVYKWPVVTSYAVTELPSGCGKITPGLASFASNASNMMTSDEESELDGAVGRYLKPLTDCLARDVPSGTPISFLATGGMRQVPSFKAAAIWRSVHRWMSCCTKYSLARAETISGNMEGVYAYLNMNNALAKAPSTHRVSGGVELDFEDERDDDQPERKVRSAGGASSQKWIGVLDMGGASFQVAFTPRSQVTILQDSYGLILPEVARRASLYSTSYQRFGQDQALRRYVSLLQKVPGQLDRAACFNRGFDGMMTTADGAAVRVRGAGDFQRCSAQLEPLLGLEHECLTEPCAMNGVYQPSVNGITFYAGATLYYTIHGLKAKGFNATDDTYTPTPAQIAAAGRAQCALPHEAAIADDPYGANYCFASAFIVRVLAAMRIPSDSTQIIYARTVPPGGSDSFDWARGAQIYRNTMEELYLHDPLR